MINQKVIVVVGPTSSGKTSLSIRLAKKFNGEIISADSRQVYKSLDIGTGKVTKEKMQGVAHHILDVMSPTDTYTVANFVKDSEIAIASILKNKHLPIITGGTFLYIDVLLGRISAPEVPPNKVLRKKLETKDTKTLFDILSEIDPNRALSIDRNNPRRLIRALEIVEALGSVPKIKTKEKYNALILGIQIQKEKLKENIHIRLEERLNKGMIDEVIQLLAGGLTHKRIEELGIEYKYISKYLQGSIDVNKMKQEIETKSWQYAKRQMTWLKRDKEIKWIMPGDIKKAIELVREFLK